MPSFKVHQAQIRAKIIAYLDLAILVVAFFGTLVGIILLSTVYEEKVALHRELVVWRQKEINPNATVEINDLHFTSFYSTLILIYIVAIGVHLGLSIVLLQGANKLNLTKCRIWFYSQAVLFVLLVLSGIFYIFINLFILIPWGILVGYRAITLWIIYNFIQIVDNDQIL